MTTGSFERDACDQKLASIIHSIERLLSGSYPHTDSENALTTIHSVYVKDRELLAKIDQTAKLDTVLEFCRRINVRIVRLKPFLGLLIRSSNLRNAFEIYFPTKILATDLLQRDDIAVVLSSEWDFSPYVYPIAPKELSEIIFIGIPASECQNPLILPLAGHELGHVVWRRQGADKEFNPRIRETVLNLYRANWQQFEKLFGSQDVSRLEADLFLLTIWGHSLDLAKRQLEEIFCDFMGVYIFGPSFLHSFRYLLAPSLGPHRSKHYPSLFNRARCMEYAANAWSVSPVADFAKSFSELELQLSPAEAFVLKIADDTTAAMYKELVPLVEKYKGRAEPFSSGAAEEKIATASFKKLVPASAASSIAAVVNAGWNVHLELDKWSILGDLPEPKRRTEKIRVLRDLILKSFEVYEYNKRLSKDAVKR